MPASKSEIYLHFVWTTYQRLPLITDDREERVYACIVSLAKDLRCWVYAINGMEDHIHLVVRIPTAVSPAALMKQVKGVSSTFIRNELSDGKFFSWQDGYGVFSLSRPHLPRLIQYVDNQKEHHRSGTIWPRWETTGNDEVTE